MSALGRALRAVRWLFEVEPVPAHVYETWRCPTCDRDVEVETVPTYMRMHGGWLPPGEVELRWLCARQHGAHRRDGRPPLELTAAEPTADLRLVVRSGADVLVLDEAMPIVLRRSGDVYEAWALEPLAASDLVGPFDRLVRRGRLLGVVQPGALRFDERGEHVDCPTLRAWQRSPASTSTTSPGGWTPATSGAGPSSHPS